MTNVAVEFYEAAAATGSTAGTPAVPRARRSRLPMLVVAYWAAAAGLAVWAPFTRLYTVSYTGGSSTEQITDGWGRMRFTGTDAGGVLGHAPRYGIVLTGIAVVLLLLGVVHLPALGRWSGLTAVARVASVAVPGLVAGVVLTLAADLEAIVSAVNAAAAQMTHATLGPSDTEVSLPRPHVGPCIWLAAASLIAATVATALGAVHRSRQSVAAAAPPTAGPGPLDMPDLDGIPGSETLG